MSEALPSPASQIMFGNACPCTRLCELACASYAAATPAVKLPALPICVSRPGHVVGRTKIGWLLATYIHPVGPTRMVLSPEALLVMRYWDGRPAASARHVRWPGTNGSDAGRGPDYKNARPEDSGCRESEGFDRWNFNSWHDRFLLKFFPEISFTFCKYLTSQAARKGWPYSSKPTPVGGAFRSCRAFVRRSFSGPSNRTLSERWPRRPFRP